MVARCNSQRISFWQAVVAADRFTPCERVEWQYAHAAEFQWPEPTSGAALSVRHEADLDIESGRVHCFDSIDSMLSSLHED